MLGCLSTIAVIAAAVGAGLGKFSFWWVMVPVFMAGSLSLSNGPAYDLVLTANRDGRVGVFPRLLAAHCLGQFALAGVAYGSTAALT